MDVKEPTVLFEKSRGSFHGVVVYLSSITYHSYHGLWVGYRKLLNGLIAAASGPACLIYNVKRACLVVL